jgi:hypothetical protein
MYQFPGSVAYIVCICATVSVGNAFAAAASFQKPFWIFTLVPSLPVTNG